MPRKTCCTDCKAEMPRQGLCQGCKELRKLITQILGDSPRDDEAAEAARREAMHRARCSVANEMIWRPKQ